MAPILEQPDLAQPTPRYLRPLVVMPIALGVVALALLIDGPAYHALLAKSTEGKDWHRLLRISGYLPTWLLLAAALAIVGVRGVMCRAGRDALLLAGAPALGGALAEGVKLLVRRVRPEDTGGLNVFLPFDQRPWDSGAFGMPSSHTAVAFGAAFALALRWPRLAPLALGLALGCGLTRVLTGAHFVSDALAGAVVGYPAAWLLWVLVGRGGAGVSAQRQIAGAGA